MNARRKSGGVVGAIGVAIAAACLVLFWAFTPIVLLPLLVCLPAAGYAWHCGWRKLGALCFVVAMAPAVFISLEAMDWIMGLCALVPAAITIAVVREIRPRHPSVEQAHGSMAGRDP